MAKKLTYEEPERRVKEFQRQVARLKALEEALLEMSDQQDVLLSTVPAMIFWIDKEGNFIRVNNAFGGALRKPPDQIKGRSLFDLYPRDMAKKYHGDNLEVISSGVPKIHIEEPVETPAGTMWVSTSKIPYTDKKHNVIGVIGFSEDITDRKRAEGALRKAHDELEEKVREQTAQLMKANKQLEREIEEHRHSQEELSQTNAKLEMLQQVSAAVHSTLDVEEVFRQITDGAVHSLGYTTAYIMVLNDEKRHFEVKVLSTKKWLLPEINKILGFPLRTFSFARDCRANALVKTVLEGRVVVAKTLAEIAYPFVTKKTCSRLQKLGGTKNYIVIPFKDQEEVVGGLIITSPREEVPREELRTVELFAQAASQAIKNAHLHMQTKQSEQALKDSEKKYRDLVEHMSEGLGIIDADGTLNYVNTRIAEMLGYSPGEMVGKPGAAFVDEGNMHLVKEEAEKRKKGIAGKFELTLVSKTGRKVPVMVSAKPVFKNGKHSGNSATFIDITERKRSEEALRQAHNELERRVKERTAQLEKANEKLRSQITERRQAEEALRDSKERFRAMADLLPTIICEIDLDSRLIYVNEAGFETFGYQQADLEAGLKVINMVHPDDRERALMNMKRVIKGEKLDGNEYRLLRKDGSELTMLVHSSPIYKNGKIIGLRSILTDITERKRSEEALRQSENKYRDLADLLPQTVFEIDERGTFTFSNRHGFESTGYTQEDIDGGLSALQLFIPEDRARVARNIRKILSGEKSEGHEYTTLRRDGTTFPVLIYSSPIIRANKPVGLRGIAIDMTERKRAEQELRESEQKYRRLFEDANDAIFIADVKTHTILDANRQAERLIGRPRKEIIGMHQSKLHPPHHAGYYGEKFRKYVHKGRILDLQAEVIRKDGGIIPVFISASVIGTHGKQMVQGLFRDAREERRILDLTEEIKTKKLMEKAKRALMDRHGISEKEAVRRLQKESRRQRKKVKEIAQAVISSELLLN